ncbi:MAG TPA: replication-relaxation family protein, partial [Ktedonobacteraceae bacterium]|nr:replication-relaxation family protein [Ktedonobacteraceae bacterium]
CPGKVLYVLSPLGSTWYLVSRQPSLTAPALREARASERTALLRLAPRVPALLTLQTVINGLVGGAAEVLTQHGHRAQLVRWNWQRDAIYSFTSQGHPMRWFADGLGAFCLHYAPSEGRIWEHWYRFFLLFLPFTHPPLMRARLDRLLRWREARERWLAYSQMPPILVVAMNAWQAQWWQEAAERVTHDLGIMLPFGAIASLASRSSSRSGEHALSSPWTWTWKRLGSQSVCHLREIFSPQDDPGFPDLFPQETFLPGQEATSRFAQDRTLWPPARSRLHHFERAKQQHLCGKKEQRVSSDGWRRTNFDLTQRQWELLSLLLAHPLLDHANLCAHLHLERSSVRHLLAPLTQACLIKRYETRAGSRFALTEHGLRLMAASAHCHVRYLVHRTETANSPGWSAEDLIPRGLPGLLKQIEHIAGVYGFFDPLASLGYLRWWETGAICARFYQSEGNWHGIRPDAIAECDFGDLPLQRPWRIWLEWDRGTMRERELQQKMSTYARYLSSREWVRDHQTPPTLLYVASDVGQERLLIRIAQTRLGSCPIRFSLYTTTRGLLMRPGLTAAIWRQVLPPVTPTADDPVLHCLFPGHARVQASAGESAW